MQNQIILVIEYLYIFFNCDTKLYNTEYTNMTYETISV